MATLLLRLAGPMQAWGTQSRFSERDTERFPSRSGILGLIRAAQGVPRDEPLDELEPLQLAVRADAPGVVGSDYQTRGGVLRNDRGRPDDIKLGTRYLLMDAVFLVGLAGETALLESVEQALRKPQWPLYLGRLAFPLAVPPVMEGGLREDSLRDAVTASPWLRYDPLLSRGWPDSFRRPEQLQVEWELPPSNTDGEPRQDLPASFAWGARFHRQRRVRREWIPLPEQEAVAPGNALDDEEFDYFYGLEGEEPCSST